MHLNPRLFHKLIAIVAIPLAFEVLLACSLFGMVSKAEMQATNERRARQASADLNDLYQRISTAAQLVGTTMFRDRATPDLISFNQQEQTIEGDLEDIKGLVGTDGTTAAQVDELNENVSASFRIIDEVLSDVQSGNRLAAIGKLRHLRSTVPVITEKLDALRAHFDQTADDEFYNQKRNRQLIQAGLVGGIAFSICLVLLMVAYIHRNITSRLQIVMENTRRLAKDQPLMPPVTGADEIAHLDRVFNDMAAALALAKRKREEMEKLKQEFVSMISHDLRTPLTSIQIFLSMLSEGMLGDVGAKISERAAMADRNATRLIGLINDLLDIDKLESGQLELACETIAITPVIERSIEAVKTLAEKQGVSVEATTCGDVQIYADADRLVQVLVNLLGNAIKFSPASGVVRIVCDQDNDFVRVNVVDQGRGVPEHLRQAIFERFKQVEVKDATEKKGTGLGLAICKAIVEGHGGKIGVECPTDRGSTFWFTLPKVKTAVVAGEQPAAAAEIGA
jgi:signal transduction histidine kinase